MTRGVTMMMVSMPMRRWMIAVTSSPPALLSRFNSNSRGNITSFSADKQEPAADGVSRSFFS
jgi:hypothetical protein